MSICPIYLYCLSSIFLTCLTILIQITISIFLLLMWDELGYFLHWGKGSNSTKISIVEKTRSILIRGRLQSSGREHVATFTKRLRINDLNLHKINKSFYNYNYNNEKTSIFDLKLRSDKQFRQSNWWLLKCWTCLFWKVSF